MEDKSDGNPNPYGVFIGFLKSPLGWSKGGVFMETMTIAIPEVELDINSLRAKTCQLTTQYEDM